LGRHRFRVARGHLFANVQTGNAIFFAMDASEGHLVTPLAHVWPILAFMAGVWLAGYLKSGWVEHGGEWSFFDSSEGSPD